VACPVQLGTEKQLDSQLDHKYGQLKAPFHVHPVCRRQVDSALNDDLGWIGQREGHIGLSRLNYRSSSMTISTAISTIFVKAHSASPSPHSSILSEREQ
jgi:hypothetical protein